MAEKEDALWAVVQHCSTKEHVLAVDDGAGAAVWGQLSIQYKTPSAMRSQRRRGGTRTRCRLAPGNRQPFVPARRQRHVSSRVATLSVEVERFELPAGVTHTVSDAP